MWVQIMRIPGEKYEMRIVKHIKEKDRNIKEIYSIAIGINTA